MPHKNVADHAENPATQKRLKMRFELIINMPVRGKTDAPLAAPPALVHRMVVDHRADGLTEFTALISERHFIIVEEFFPGPSGSWKSAVSNGAITVNTDLIGKVREWNQNNHVR